jgi:hypothetical protein
MADARALLAKVIYEDKPDTNFKADKKAESRGGFFGGGGSAKYEEAAELYTQAANAFRLQKLGPLPFLPTLFPDQH